jgi:glutamate transport system substrate-binding protein
MRLKRLLALAAIGALALTSAAACGESKLDSEKKGGGYEIVKNPSFPAGSTMERLAKAKAITVGVKFDQPGLGNKNPSTGKIEGFDIEIAKIIAGQLGIDYNNGSQFKPTEAISKNREPFIQQGTVDMVVATYSITDKRKKLVAFAGPYYVTGQQLLIRKTDQDKIKGPQDLAGKKVCSVTGSTPIANIEKNYPKALVTGLGTYSECVEQLENNTVDVVTTDGAILLGFAARNPEKLIVVGDEFSEEKYGIGVKKEDTAFRNFINDSLEKAFKNGDWKKAYDATLGKSGTKAPEPPAVSRY